MTESPIRGAYDAETWEAIDGWQRDRRGGQPPASSRKPSGRGAAAGAALAVAAFTGVREAVEPDEADPQEEFELAVFDRSTMPVVYHHVPGDPAASVAYVRPWLF
jgi:hypothetical protein